jgi:PAS domain S-box-containing protein
MLPMVTVALCFAVEYAGLVKWLTLRMFVILAIVPITFTLLVFTNGLHHLVWKRIWFDGCVRTDLGPAHWGAIGYGYFLSLLHLTVLAWLFVRSPRHRWVVIGLIFALFSLRGASFFGLVFRNPVAPLNPMVLVLNLALLPYAFAIVRFRMFEVVPVARDAAVECMADGLMVLDAENRVADVNQAAQKLFGITRQKVAGLQVAQVLEAWPDLLECVRNNPGETECEVSFGDTSALCYQASISHIIDRRGFQLGRLIMLRNITEQKRAQAQVLDQERALAMLKERELLARELHDGIGQTAAAAHMQIACAREFLARGDTASLESCLHNLADTTQEVKKSVRDYLLGVKTGSSAKQGFLPGIRQYIGQYSQKYGIHTELVAPPELEEQPIDSTIEAQLQPIIQEALTNVRKHSGARSARVIFTPCESQVLVTIEDDGQSFNPEAVSDNQGFGLRSMRGRAEALGGRLEVNATPGKGTLVSIQVPWRKEDT